MQLLCIASVAQLLVIEANLQGDDITKAERKLKAVRWKAKEAWETMQKRVDDRLTIKTTDLHAQVMRVEDLAVRRESKLSKVFVERDIAWKDIEKVNERVWMLEVESDTTFR